VKARTEQRRQEFPNSIGDGAEVARWHLNAKLRLDLIQAERAHLHGLLRDGKITDESRRRLERELDLEEESIACKGDGEEPPL
jgi:hypothetical protein